MIGQRPDPDKLLEKLKEQDKTGQKGRLKIFFGYAAGVGKTYAMLEAAQIVKKSGVDVVAGYVEPHARPETIALQEGLEVLAPLIVEHKGIKLKEFDLDAAVIRHPSLILVDELAHTNAEGCRHKKRYQDIEELLNTGIDVYTTVNVQHIESLNDIVASITGVIVQERIPDKIFDNASQVELVDIEPADLIERLNEGKVYREKQAKTALKNFFSEENLTALREIALRCTADHVNQASEKNKQETQVFSGGYFTKEHILICLSPSPSNGKVIRAAARMTKAFKGSFTALYVETPESKGMSGEDERRLRANEKLAKQLGARIVTTYGEDVPLQIAEYARLAQVSKIIIGRTNTKKGLFSFRPSLAEKLSELAPNLDIYIIPDNTAVPYRRKRAARLKSQDPSEWVWDILKSAGILAGATIVSILFEQTGFSEANIIMVYILGVLLTAVVTSQKKYSIIASFVSVFTFNFFFTVPKYTFQAYAPEYPVTFLIMFLSALITGTFTTRVKHQAKQSALQAYRTEVLLETSQKLQQTDSYPKIIFETANQLVRLLKRTVIYYPVLNGTLVQPKVFSRIDGSREDTSLYITPEEQAVAAWVYKNNKHAGAFTNTLPSAKCMYLAIRGSQKVYAVVGVALNGQPLESFENNLLISVLGESALAFEKEELYETKNQAAMQAQQEKLRANLLRAISHDLRTPLTSISGNADILLGNGASLDESKKIQLYQDIYDDSIWLINLVENLLSVTRIEDGTMNIHMEAQLVSEVIDEALAHINRKGCEHCITKVIPDDMIMARMDSRLIVQVIINIVDNAIKYTQPGSHIEISARREKAGGQGQSEFVAVEIADDGEGIPDEAKEKLFEMFYTGGNKVADSRRGMGLGLALCRSIVMAHGGMISVEDNKPRGSRFKFTLPAEEVTLHE